MWHQIKLKVGISTIVSNLIHFYKGAQWDSSQRSFQMLQGSKHTGKAYGTERTD